MVVAFGETTDQLPRPIAGSIVHKHNFIRFADRPTNRCDLAIKLGQHRFFIEAGGYDGKIWHNPQFPLPQSARGFFRKTMLAFPNGLERRNSAARFSSRKNPDTRFTSPFFTTILPVHSSIRVEETGKVR